MRPVDPDTVAQIMHQARMPECTVFTKERIERIAQQVHYGASVESIRDTLLVESGEPISEEQAYLMYVAAKLYIENES